MEINDHHKDDREYFDAIYDQLNGDGMAALLHPVGRERERGGRGHDDEAGREDEQADEGQGAHIHCTGC